MRGKESSSLNPFADLWEQAKHEWERKKGVPGLPSWAPELLEEILLAEGLEVLEAGSGMGIISLELASRGVRCTLLDVSKAALELSREFFLQEGREAEFVQGDIFHLPFREESFDVVWNAGVLEHFEEEGTAAGLKEMCRVCRRSGRVVVAVPSSRAVIYRLGKWVQEKRGTWPYGYERPMRTLAPLSPPGWRCVREYQIGTRDQAGFWPLPGRRPLVKLFELLLRGREKDRLLTQVAGGYLLVSVWAADSILGPEQE